MNKRRPTTIKVDARQLSLDGIEDLRRRGMEMLKAGISQTQVSRNLGVHRQTVIGWKKRMEGLDIEQAIQSKKRGPKPGNSKKAILTAEQQSSIRQTIMEENPAQHGIGSALWTSRAVQSLIMKMYQIDIKRRTLWNYLNAWGFTAHQPSKPRAKKHSVS